jgi:peroxiredoxin
MSKTVFPQTLDELEQEFAALADEIPESPEKRALSVLHGIVMEVRRDLERDCPEEGDGVLTLRDVADLWRSAPAMEGEAVNTPLAPGTIAPDFALPDASGRPIRLSDFRGRPVVLVFYPLDWSPGCSQQLDLYQQELDEFRSRGAEVVAISVDSLYSHGAWAAVRGITFPLLADFHPKGAVARDYSVWREPDGFSERALYVIEPNGMIAYSHVAPFVHHVPDIYELLQVLDELAGAKV